MRCNPFHYSRVFDGGHAWPLYLHAVVPRLMSAPSGILGVA